MSIKYFVTKNPLHISSPSIVLGDFPGWKPRYWDIYFFCAPSEILIEKMPFPGSVSILEREINIMARHPDFEIQGVPVIDIVCPRISADTITAAAWLQLKGDEISPEVRDRLRAIASCGQKLVADKRWDRYGIEAIDAIRNELKNLWMELEIPSDPNLWDEAQRIAHHSTAFENAVLWLLDAARGIRPWPGT